MVRDQASSSFGTQFITPIKMKGLLLLAIAAMFSTRSIWVKRDWQPHGITNY